MPKSTSKIRIKDENLYDIEDSQLDLLESYCDEALGKIWIRSRRILFERNRKKNLKNKSNSITYSGPKVSCIQLEKVVLSNIESYNKQINKPKFNPIKKLHCYGECYDNCIFGVKDIEDEWHCIFPQSKLNVTSRPEGKNGRNKIETI